MSLPANFGVRARGEITSDAYGGARDWALGAGEEQWAVSSRQHGAKPLTPLWLDIVGARAGNIALSLGERVSGDGAFSSRRRTGEGSLPPPGEVSARLSLDAGKGDDLRTIACP